MKPVYARAKMSPKVREILRTKGRSFVRELMMSRQQLADTFSFDGHVFSTSRHSKPAKEQPR